MKKLTLLLLLFPLIGFSQETPIAWHNNQTMVVSNAVKDQMQQALDSVAYGVYTVDTTWVMDDSVVQIMFSHNDTLYTDIIIGYRDHDTVYTHPAMYACGVTCKNYNECVGGSCYKTTDCKCRCTGDGGCTDIWLSVFGEAPIGEVLRERILISIGHYIPRD